MRFHYLIEQIYHRPWFATPETWHAIHQTFQAAMRRRGAITSLATIDDETEEQMLKRFDETGIKLADMINTRQPMTVSGDGIARIHILGPLARNLSKLERACGATGYEQIQADFNRAVAQNARGILLVVNSGGGTVNGCPETAALISEIGLRIPVVAQTSDVMGSGAYYVSAGATRIVASRSAVLGSIGIIIPWVDFSAEMKMLGLVGDPITNAEGDLKGAGWVTGSLTPAQRAHWQGETQSMFEDFKGHVLAHRAVPPEAMRGQTLYGQAMLDANLIDEFGDEAHALDVLKSLATVTQK